MELGLDIGEIDTIVMLDVPPSMKSFWQRLGRGGRRREEICLLIDPEDRIREVGGFAAYMKQPLEPSWLYLDNRYIQYGNALCAAVELNDIGETNCNFSHFNSLPAGFRSLLENELRPKEMIPQDLYMLKQRGR